jgi:ribosome-associated toxin RatA of RatAB toxin-antitoxin module
MPTYEASASIATPAEAVWRILSDVASWPDWLPTVDAVEALDTEAPSLGSRFVVRQPKLRPVTRVVTELDPPRRFVWIARSPGLALTAEHTIDPQGPTASKVLLRFSFAGLLGGIVGRVFRSITESYLAQEAASLKQRTEAFGDGQA